MQQWFSFAIAAAALMVLTLTLMKSQKQNSSNLKILSLLVTRQVQMNQTLTNLLLSKDPMTFQQIQAMTNSQQVVDLAEPVNPLDDVSQAMALAEQYKRHGFDPNSAFAQDEQVNFAEEFGL